MIYKTNSGYGVNFNQLVQNGNFVNDSGWFSVEGTKSISNNEAILTPSSSASYPGIGKPIGTTILGHKYLVFLQFKGENKLALNCGGLNAQIVSGLDIANYNDVGYIFTSTASNTYFTFFVVNGRNSQYYKNVCLFDLTQMFGSGNEPTTVAEFREMYSNDYYDYTLSDWQWSKKGKITSYPTPVIENGITLLPIENHIVGVAKRKNGETDFDGVQGYQYGYSLNLTKINALPLNTPITFEIQYSSGKGQNWQFGFRLWYESIPDFDSSPLIRIPQSIYTETTYIGTFTLREHCKLFALYIGGEDTDQRDDVYFNYVKMTYYDGATLIYNYAKRELPVGFVRLDYIESTGTQWIDTGVNFFSTENNRLDMDVGYMDYNTYNQFWGSSYDADTYEAWTYTNNNLFVARYNNQRVENLGYLIPNSRYILSFIRDDNSYKVIINAVEKGSITLTSSYTRDANLHLLHSGTDNSKLKLYVCRVYMNGVLVRNFIPCYRYSDGIEGLYDTVGKQFYTNQGTGRFLRGKEIDSGNLLDLSKFTRGYPSNTAFENTTKRTFIENTYVVGLSLNNYYAASNSSITINEQSMQVYSAGGYGCAFALDLNKNKKYKAYWSGNSVQGIYLMYYSADGTFISYTNIGSNGENRVEFTTLSDFGYVLLDFVATNETTATFSNISLHEVN